MNMTCEELNCDGLFNNMVSDLCCANMIRNITDLEIKEAMFSIGNDKSLGPDGYTSNFFKKGWDIVGQDVCKAIRDFFTNGQMLKEINHTFIALIPKVSTPLCINDYLPISWCNVIYKCISKILTNRIIEGIMEVVSDNQSAFVLGRRIFDNILITQELMHGYHRDRGPPRCDFKIDIQKSYDTVDWHFLGVILKRFGFHPLMIKWIMACVTSTSFSIRVNGDVYGFFKGKQGLRPGDPLSPYLFTLVIEVLTLILKRHVRASDSFRYHKHYEELQLINVCFTDDLFIFAQGDVESAQVIMKSLEEFKQVSGLIPSLPKSMAYFCNVVRHTKLAILNIMPFSERTLPVIYLGVPLYRLDFLIRIASFCWKKAKNRIRDWKNKSLSFSGRL
ncbi:protein LAZ1 [Tanacetum coccineum]